MNARSLCLLVAIAANAAAIADPMPNWTRPINNWDYDDKRILGYVKNDVCLWDAKTGKLLQKMVGHGERIYAVRLSPNGKQAVSSSWLPPNELSIRSKETATRLWDLATGKELRRFDGQIAGTFSRDGKRLLLFSIKAPQATGFDAAIWDAKTGKRLATAKLEPYATPQYDGDLRFSPDEKQFSYSDQGHIQVFDSRDGIKLTEKGREPIALRVYPIPPDRAVIWSLHDVHVYDLKNQKILRSFPAKTEDWLFNASTIDGKIMIGAGEGPLTVLDLETGKEMRIADSGPYPRHFVMGPDDKRFLVQWGQGYEVGGALYDLQTGKQIAILKALSQGLPIGFAPDAKTILVNGKTFSIYDATTGKPLRELTLEGF